MDGSAATHVPHFDVPASTGQNLSLDSFVGKVPFAMVFLTGLGSDRELIEALNDALPEFGKERSQVLAVAQATADDLRRFAEANDIVMPILADASGTVSRDFGAHDERGNPVRLAVVATAEGRMVSRLEILHDSDVVELLLTELRDLHLGADVEPVAEEE